MPVGLQPKLLRVLNDGRVRRLGGRQEIAFDVRVIAATNSDPLEAIGEKRFREDLYYRLAVFSIALPPLRERKTDVPPIAQHFVEEFGKRHGSAAEGIREAAMEALKHYSWPGNVRELRNVIERAVVLAEGPWIEAWHLPPYIRDPDRMDSEKVVLKVGNTTVEDAERELILKTLEKAGNNKAEAARLLGVDVKTIRNKLGRYRKGAE
jgi:DNA-binding NtrC family response regulator